MMESLSALYTKALPVEEIIERKELSLWFALHYLSFDSQNAALAQRLNRYLFVVRDKIIWDLLYLGVPKTPSFRWNAAFVKKGDAQEETAFEKSVRKYYGWSRREYRLQKEFVLPQAEAWAEKFALDNAERKEIGLAPIKLSVLKTEKIEVLAVKGGLAAWF